MTSWSNGSGTGRSGRPPALIVGRAPASREHLSFAALDCTRLRLLHGCASGSMLGRSYDEFESLSTTRETGSVPPAVRRFADLAAGVLATPGPVRIVGVDGCGGSGKTTFAARLAAAAG